MSTDFLYENFIFFTLLTPISFFVVFVASQLSQLPNLPENVSSYGRVSPGMSRLEAIWRRYHWIGLFNYRHAFHSVDERAPCHLPSELSRVRVMLNPPPKDYITNSVY